MIAPGNDHIFAKDIICYLCLQTGGLMKQVGPNGKWACVLCINWIPEVYFEDDAKTIVRGTVPKERFELSCKKCRKQGGALIQCDYKGCHVSQHVRCAVNSHWIKTWEEIEDLTDNVEGQIQYVPIFCK